MTLALEGAKRLLVDFSYGRWGKRWRQACDSWSVLIGKDLMWSSGQSQCQRQRLIIGPIRRDQGFSIPDTRDFSGRNYPKIEIPGSLWKGLGFLGITLLCSWNWIWSISYILDHLFVCQNTLMVTNHITEYSQLTKEQSLNWKKVRRARILLSC